MKLKRLSSGITLLEVMVSLVIMSGAIAGLAMISQGYIDSTQRSMAAQQVRTLGEAAKAYIRDNYAAVQAVATPTTPALIDVATLIASGRLTTGFSFTNSFGQSMCVLVLEPTANRLQALVVTEGGTAVDDLSLGELAATIGGSGGGVYSTNAAAIKGSFGGWQIPVSTFDNLTNNVNRRCDGSTGAVRLVTGRPAMALWFESGDTQSAFMSRDVVPGRPELNAMNAPLVMNSVQTVSGACTTVGAIARDVTGGVLACKSGQWTAPGGGSAYWADPVANFASLPVCNVSSAGATRLVMSPSTGVGPVSYACNGAAWAALAVDNAGNIGIPRKITGSGGDAVYGALTVQGEKGGWSGMNFRQANGSSSGSLMMHPSYSGFYNAADSNWRWYVDDAGNSWQPSNANVGDVYIRAMGRWASQIRGLYSTVYACPDGTVRSQSYNLIDHPDGYRYYTYCSAMN